jgi:hypothetical protein
MKKHSLPRNSQAETRHREKRTAGLKKQLTNFSVRMNDLRAGMEGQADRFKLSHERLGLSAEEQRDLYRRMRTDTYLEAVQDVVDGLANFDSGPLR